jgi:hypothetical protein
LNPHVIGACDAKTFFVGGGQNVGNALGDAIAVKIERVAALDALGICKRDRRVQDGSQIRQSGVQHRRRGRQHRQDGPTRRHQFRSALCRQSGGEQLRLRAKNHRLRRSDTACGERKRVGFPKQYLRPAFGLAQRPLELQRSARAAGEKQHGLPIPQVRRTGAGDVGVTRSGNGDQNHARARQCGGHAAGGQRRRNGGGRSWHGQANTTDRRDRLRARPRAVPQGNAMAVLRQVASQCQAAVPGAEDCDG